MAHTTLQELQQHFTHHAPKLVGEPVQVRASVALVLCEQASDLHLLFIQRAISEGDRWSGDIAFPGGRLDTTDSGPQETAERETREEVGLDLLAEHRIGRLDDLLGTSESICVSAFIYGLSDPGVLCSNPEVERPFWVALEELENPARQVQRTFDYLGQELALPAIQVLEEEAPVLWGLSYRFLEIFMEKLGRTIPGMPWARDL